VFELYLPRQVLDLAGRRFDRQHRLSPGSQTVLRRVTTHRDAPEDWLQVYVIQMLAWFWLVIASLALFVVVSLLLRFLANGREWWVPISMGLASITPGLLSFYFVLQAHIQCVDRPADGRFARIVDYFRYPKPVNLVIVPIFWLVSFTIMLSAS
jgi:hypothetical protein